jgi:hypothetical protein
MLLLFCMRKNTSLAIALFADRFLDCHALERAVLVWWGAWVALEWGEQERKEERKGK